MQDISTDILIQAAKGNMEAFKQIYTATAGFVYSIALRITHNIDDAQEVTQDVFIKIYKNLKDFEYRCSFKTWVYRIATNTAINMYRKTSKETSRRADYDIMIKTESSPEKAEEVVTKENNERLISSLLNLLNPDQRACIILREIEGLNYKEIARVLKININTVRSRLKRAREALLAYSKGEVIKDEL